MLRDKPARLDPDEIAIAALGFIAGDAERLARFLALTGLGPGTLRAAATEPAFLARVLDFLAEDDSALIAFAANQGLAPEAVMRARQRLAGGAG